MALDLRIARAMSSLSVSESEGKDGRMDVDTTAGVKPSGEPGGIAGEKVGEGDQQGPTTTDPGLTASQSSLRSAPDYDSSATLSADEGPGGPGSKSHDDSIPSREAAGKFHISIQGNSGPMVLHKCLAKATCICSKSN